LILFVVGVGNELAPLSLCEKGATRCMKKNAWGRTPPYLWSMPIEIKPTLKYLKELEEQLYEFELSDV